MSKTETVTVAKFRYTLDWFQVDQVEIDLKPGRWFTFDHRGSSHRDWYLCCHDVNEYGDHVVPYWSGFCMDNPVDALITLGSRVSGFTTNCPEEFQPCLHNLLTRAMSRSAPAAVATAATAYDRRADLQCWFGLSYASFCVLPRVLMEAMPSEWQSKMAELLREYSEAFDTGDLPSAHVSAREGNRFTKWPDWLLDSPHPSQSVIEEIRRGSEGN